MKKQKASEAGNWADQVRNYRSRKPKAKARKNNYSAPRDGIVMHIDELKDKLRSIQVRFGVDPSLLPEFIR